ncbi:type II secretion system protein [Sulfurospirillum sp. 1307]|jgi:hypothetical protein
MKKGSSLIELVIAIVVMGIAVTVLPIILTTVLQNNLHVKVVEDEIASGITRFKTITTGWWDENTKISKKILHVQSGDSELDSRPGLIEADGRRKFGDLNASSIGMDSNETAYSIDDIDDLDGNVSSYATASGNYPLNVTSTISVNYLNDTNNYANPITFDINVSNISVNSTNIKLITNQINIQNVDEDLNQTLIFRAIRANIGTSTWKERVF